MTAIKTGLSAQRERERERETRREEEGGFKEKSPSSKESLQVQQQMQQQSLQLNPMQVLNVVCVHLLHLDFLFRDSVSSILTLS
jgi:hypothetical protein